MKLTKIFKKIVAAFLVAVLVICSLPAASYASGSAQMYVSPSSSSVNTGSNLTVSVVLNTGGTGVNSFQTTLSFSGTQFSYVSASAGSFSSGFQATPSGSSVFLAGGSLSLLNGTYTAATVVLHANSTGSATISLSSACAGSGGSSCSIAFDPVGGQNVLAGVAGGSYTVTTAPTPTPTPTSSGKSTGSNKGGNSKKTTAPSPSPTPAAATTTTTTASTSTTTQTKPAEPATLNLTVLDGSGKPLAGAVVTIDGKTGTADYNGKVTIKGVSPGINTVNITYKDLHKPVKVTVKDGAVQPIQSAKVSLNAKNSSVLTPLGIVLLALLLAAGGAAFYIQDKVVKQKRIAANGSPAQQSVTSLESPHETQIITPQDHQTPQLDRQ